MAAYLDFEKPIAELQARISELREAASGGTANIDAELAKLESKADRLLADTYARLTPWHCLWLSARKFLGAHCGVIGE